MIDELYQQIELEMLANIGKIIGNGDGVDEDDIINWQVQKLSQLGQLSEAQIKTLAKYAGMTAEQMTVFIQQTAITEVAAYDMLMDDMTEGKVLYTPPSNTLYTALEALEKQGQSVINMINTNLLQASGQVYTDILTKSAAQVLTGNITLQQALVDTAGEWAKQGMPALVDKAGRTWSTEAYVNMVARATQKNVATSMQESRMDDYEIDLVEISSHAASRPSHIDYQGKIYSRSGESKTYPSLKDTSYGKGADGLVTGIGCNHIAYPYIEGVSTKRYEPYNKKESIEAYKDSQKQRYLEREIRRSKKELAMLEQMDVDADEIDKARQKVADKQANMRKFIKKTGRTRRPQKERIVDVGKKVDIPKNAKVLPGDEVIEKMTRNDANSKHAEIINSVKKSFERSGVKDAYGEDFYNSLLKNVENIDDDRVARLFDRYADKVVYHHIDSKRMAEAFRNSLNANPDFLKGNNGVFRENEVFFHEFGHIIDYYGILESKGVHDFPTGKTKWIKFGGKQKEIDITISKYSALDKFELKKKLSSDLERTVLGDTPTQKAFDKALGKRPKDGDAFREWQDKSYAHSEVISEKWDSFRENLQSSIDENPYLMHAVSDILESTKKMGRTPFGFGHPKGYWDDAGQVETEFFANVTSSLIQNKEAFELIKEIFPTSVDTYFEIVEEILKAGE